MLTKKVKRKTADNVTEAIIKLLRPFKTWAHTLTADNGREFSSHIHIAKQLKTKFYFVHPYSPWDCGLNENTKGLIPQYLPKKHDFIIITHKQIENVVNKLNHRPRKCLGFKAPMKYSSRLNHLLH